MDMVIIEICYFTGSAQLGMDFYTGFDVIILTIMKTKYVVLYVFRL